MSSFDTDRGQDIANPAVPVTVTFQTPISEAAVIQPGRSLATQQAWHSPKKLMLSVPDEIVVLKLTPRNIPAASAPAPPTGVRSAATGSEITLTFPPVRGQAQGYFVSRLGQFLGRTVGESFTDTELQPNTGYTYQLRNYNSDGRVSAPATVVVRTQSQMPDLTATELSWIPTPLRPGDNVRFQITIKNIGTGSTPANITHGIGFFVDGTFVSWSDSFSGPLAPGGSKILQANSGPQKTAFWTATPGPHTVTAQVDDLNRITESIETNNAKTQSFVVTGGAAP